MLQIFLHIFLEHKGFPEMYKILRLVSQPENPGGGKSVHRHTVVHVNKYLHLI